VPPSTVRKSFLRMCVRSSWELYAICNPPVVYNLIDFGEISDHAVRGLDVTTAKQNSLVCYLSTRRQTGPHTCASTGEDCTAGRGSDMTWIQKRLSALFSDPLDAALLATPLALVRTPAWGYDDLGT